MSTLKIVLTAVDEPLASAWNRHCEDLDFVSVHRGNILDLEVDAVVSPANSFGFMDGGVDAVYTRHFGKDLQKHLQEIIRDRHHGELLVGTAEILPTNDPKIPFLISAPTMRVPMILRDSANPFLAARAALLLTTTGSFLNGDLAGEPISSKVQSIAFPGLGTGVGGVGPETCAHQVRCAIEDSILKIRPFPRTWAEAQANHQLLYTDRIRDLQKP